MEEHPQPEWGIKLSRVCPIPQRIILTFMGFWAMVNAYTMRICISMAITQLVVTRNYTETDVQKEVVCPADPDDPPDSRRSGGGIYDWSQQLQGFIISCFYIGYIITHIPGGMLAEKYGGKYVLSCGMLSSAIFTLLTPWVLVNWGVWAMIAFRILMGVGEGTTFPALSTLMSKWVPKRERSILGAIVMGAGQVGSILANWLSGWLMTHWEWPIVFYVFGFACVVWFIFFSFMCWSYPATHPYIKPSERVYLMTELGQLKRPQHLVTPWKDILTSAAMWALIIAQLGHDWGFFVMTHDLQKYMHDVMQFSIQMNGVYSSLPFITTWVVSIICGVVSDVIINRHVMSITNLRKTNTFLAAFFPGLFMVLASYAGCNRVLVVTSFTVGMAFMGCYYSGMKLTALDLSPNFSGIVMALTNGIAALMGLAAPYMVGVLTPNTTLFEWRLVFWISFAILTVTAIVFCIWASGEVQPWNEGKQAKEKD